MLIATPGTMAILAILGIAMGVLLAGASVSIVRSPRAEPSDLQIAPVTFVAGVMLVIVGIALLVLA